MLAGALFWLPQAHTTVSAQSAAIEGAVLEETDNSETIPLQGVNLQLFTLPDSSRTAGAASGQDGSFRINNLKAGSYLLVATYLGFETATKSIQLEEGIRGELSLIMKPSAIQLDEFQVLARRPRVDVRGDTTAFHAGGYQTGRDSNIQDLVTRMPGFIMENGRLQAQGEDVAMVLVDGEEFFGDDAAMALQNLPAEIVAEIEVFDRESEQARFTGFRDGNTSRTINIVTKEGMNRGQFGRGSSGYGSQTRYMAGGNYNYFQGATRLSLIGMTNNLNQHNFSSEDLLGVSEAAGSGRSGGRAAGNFRTGGQSGISSVHSLGFNYNDRWNDTWRVNTSYFYNMTDNSHNQFRERLYLSGSTADQRYDEQSRRTSDNYNHRFDMRLEHDFDDRRSIVLRPRARFQHSRSFQSVDALTLNPDMQLLNEIFRENSSDQSSYNIGGTLLYRHRFETRGRTFSANLSSQFSDRSGTRNQLDENQYYDESENLIVNDQLTETLSGESRLSGTFTYTEPLTENTRLMVDYRPSFEDSRSVQDVFRFDEETQSYSSIDPGLTSRYDNRLFTNRMRSSYRFNREKINANVSLSWQHTSLTGNQEFPVQGDISQSWQNLLPGASIQYRFDRRSNIRLSYNANTRTPSVRQLQDVIDNSDPLRLTTGNSGLDQQYDHRFSARLRMANPEEGSSLSAFVSMNITDNFIGNRTFIAEAETELDGGIVMAPGARLISPDNIGRSFNLFSRVNRSRPVDLLQSNLNMNAGVSFNRRPSYIGDERNLTDNTRLSSGFQISSNISDRIDFRAAYDAGYHIVENSIRPELNNNYYSGRAMGSFNLMPWKGLLLASEFNLRHYNGLGEDFNQSTLFWNGSMGYKFFDDESAELRITLFDILGQNDNINRNILEDYIEDYRSNVLSRYVLFSFSYRFRSFSG